MSAEADNLAATTTQLVAAALFVAPVILIADTGGKTELASADFTHLLAAATLSSVSWSPATGAVLDATRRAWNERDQRLLDIKST